MKCYDSLRITFEPSIETFNKLTSIMGVQPKSFSSHFREDLPSCWIYEVIDDKKDEWFDFINVFLDLLETKNHEIEELNIKRENISIWLLYEYDQQCNMEFNAQRLKRLGDSGITFCISCWNSGKEFGDENE